MVRKLNGERREIDKKQEGYRKVRYERNIHIHQFILALLRLEIFYGMEENVKLHICSVQRRAETEQSWHSCLSNSVCDSAQHQGTPETTPVNFVQHYSGE